jgi:hypothetical protein
VHLCGEHSLESSGTGDGNRRVELPHQTGHAAGWKLRRSKTRQASAGASSYLSRETVRRVTVRLFGRNKIGPRLNAVRSPTFTNGLRGWDGRKKKVKDVSGYSIRVGATQDLLELNIELASAMQAGRWKSTAMPMRHGENVLPARGGMARAAELEGRNERDIESQK